MLSAGMLTDLASATTVRSRGLLSLSPPPARAATVSSLMMRVKIFPRFASAAPFLCLIVAHLEWPDMMKLQRNLASLSAHLTTPLPFGDQPGTTSPVRHDRPRLSANDSCSLIFLSPLSATVAITSSRRESSRHRLAHPTGRPDSRRARHA